MVKKHSNESLFKIVSDYLQTESSIKRFCKEKSISTTTFYNALNLVKGLTFEESEKQGFNQSSLLDLLSPNTYQINFYEFDQCSKLAIKTGVSNFEQLLKFYNDQNTHNPITKKRLLQVLNHIENRQLLGRYSGIKQRFYYYISGCRWETKSKNHINNYRKLIIIFNPNSDKLTVYKGCSTKIESDYTKIKPYLYMKKNIALDILNASTFEFRKISRYHDKRYSVTYMADIQNCSKNYHKTYPSSTNDTRVTLNRRGCTYDFKAFINFLIS